MGGRGVGGMKLDLLYVCTRSTFLGSFLPDGCNAKTSYTQPARLIIEKPRQYSKNYHGPVTRFIKPRRLFLNTSFRLACSHTLITNNTEIHQQQDCDIYE